MKILCVMLLVIASCSTPANEPEPECHLTVSWDRVSPVGSGPFEVQHHSSTSLAFSVTNAIETCDSLPLKVYWFVDFDPASDALPAASEPDYLLTGCHPKLAGAYPKTVMIEALATQGELSMNSQSPDPRVTLAGEPVQHLVWTVVVTHHPDTDCH